MTLNEIELEAQIKVFKKEAMELWFVPNLADTYKNKDLFSYSIMDGEVLFMREQARQLWSFWNKAKAQAVPEWTSVNDSLPAYEKLVLIKTNKGAVQGYLFQDEEYSEMKGEYLKYDSWQDDFHDDFIEYEDVTHWMPFPKAIIKSGAEG
ncbi:TPA: DUF551 domain-containing protein [Acinetobacter nosocomialis]|nr:DUF551 domain-containing protein [Acinetobacter nosocomialis]